MSISGELSKKSILELQEMLAREKALISNARFLQKLPDRGAKLIEKVEKIEKELTNRKLATKTSENACNRRSEVEKLEWTLHNFEITSSPLESDRNNMSNLYSNDNQKGVTIGNEVNDSPDEQHVQSDTDFNETNEEMTLKMLATSQISQNQPKAITVACGSSTNITPTNREVDNCPLYLKMLANTLEHKSSKCRFVPNRPKCSLPTSPNTNNISPNSPTLPKDSLNDDFQNCSVVSAKEANKKTNNWDESLLPPKNIFGTVQPLSLEESFQLNTEQSNRLQKLDVKQKAQPMTVCAYDALIESATCGTASLILSPPKDSNGISDDEIDDPNASDIESDLSEEDDVDEGGNISPSESDGEIRSRIETLTQLINAGLKMQ